MRAVSNTFVTFVISMGFTSSGLLGMTNSPSCSSAIAAFCWFLLVYAKSSLLINIHWRLADTEYNESYNKPYYKFLYRPMKTRTFVTLLSNIPRDLRTVPPHLSHLPPPPPRRSPLAGPLRTTSLSAGRTRAAVGTAEHAAPATRPPAHPRAPPARRHAPDDGGPAPALLQMSTHQQRSRTIQ